MVWPARMWNSCFLSLRTPVAAVELNFRGFFRDWRTALASWGWKANLGKWLTPPRGEPRLPLRDDCHASHGRSQSFCCRSSATSSWVLSSRNLASSCVRKRLTAVVFPPRFFFWSSYKSETFFISGATRDLPLRSSRLIEMRRDDEVLKGEFWSVLFFFSWKERANNSANSSFFVA